ncbi:MAG: multiheme c-type cytochrome [Sedimentisphaerales bacterium]|nr:multiheme c-type cytochrome [Sedimentisphaerales bacterium]
MKYYFLIVVLAIVVIVGACCQNVKLTQKEQAEPEPVTGTESITTEAVTIDEEPLLLLDEEPLLLLDEEPLLLLDDEPLLLLDEEPDEELPSESMADNSRCFVCHVNYMQEKIAVTHASQNMGCAYCHGNSDEHIADESWASGGNGTAPDIMYPRDKINSFCMGCHTKDKIDTEQHNPLFADNSEKNCTDCHGEHRLTNRKCKWK